MGNNSTCFQLLVAWRTGGFLQRLLDRGCVEFIALWMYTLFVFSVLPHNYFDICTAFLFVFFLREHMLMTFSFYILLEIDFPLELATQSLPASC